MLTVQWMQALCDEHPEIQSVTLTAESFDDLLDSYPYTRGLRGEKVLVMGIDRSMEVIRAKPIYSPILRDDPPRC